MFRVMLGPNDKRSLEETNSALDTWVANHSEWTGDYQEHRVVETDTSSGYVYWNGGYRFHIVDAKDNLWTKLEDKLVNKHDWYRLGFHVCEHDDRPVGNCGWDEKREWVDKDVVIPSEIPDFL